jgi:superfamily II DNA or RNA helicase
MGTAEEQSNLDMIAYHASPRCAILSKLHTYQSTSLQLSYEAWIEHVYRQLIVLPTGAGKTVVFGVLPIWHRFTRRILVLVHRDTLAEQAKKTIQQWNPYAGNVGIEMGQKYHAKDERIVVASVQTIGNFSCLENADGTISFKISKRLAKFNPDDFDAIVVDECHHSCASGYMNIFRYFGFLDDSFKKVAFPPKRLLLGVTATPRRLDKKRLSDIFDRKVFDYPIEDAIREGFLVNPRCYRVRTSISIEDISLDDDTRLEDDDQNNSDKKTPKKSNEQIQEELSKRLNTPERNKLIVAEWLDKAKGRKTICFTVDVKHAIDIAQAFRDAGVSATAVWGDDPAKKQKLKHFKDGRYSVLVNCELLIEGYDERSVSCVILARPTDSESMFKQMCGRAMRLEDGVLNILVWDSKHLPVTKRDCIIIEVQDKSSKRIEHSLAMTFAQAYGLPDDFDLVGRGLLEAKNAIYKLKSRTRKRKIPENNHENKVAGLSPDKKVVVAAVVEEVDLLKVTFDSLVTDHSRLQWHRTGHENYVLMLPDKIGYIRLWRNIDGRIVIDGRNLREPYQFFMPGTRRNESFGFGLAAADQQVLKRFGEKTFRTCDRDSSSASWKLLPASKATITRLRQLYDSRGLTMPDNVSISRGEACMLITRMMASTTES